MKHACLLIFGFCCAVMPGYCQVPDTSVDHIQVYFTEAANATSAYAPLWNKNIYGPMLLINPATRQVYANEPDSAATFQQQGTIYTGALPGNINIANTAVQWQGKTWAMMMLPLPENKSDRINLVTHELFHKAQAGLSFVTASPINDHLDKKEGRVYLRLELQAMLKALHAADTTSRNNYLTDAFTFRRYRYWLYPGADTLENALELNEGLAEFTGITMSGRDKAAMQLHFDQSVNAFLHNATFVRSFAYQTIPVYGYLLAQTQPGWNKAIQPVTNLADYFITAFHLSLPANVKAAAVAKGALYNGAVIIAAETAREEKLRQVLAAYKKKFVTQPHTELRFEHMGISFDPRNIVPLDDYGTVYPTIRVTDQWGILTVTEGALVSSAWDKISVGLPATIHGNKINGQGWELQLADGYKLAKAAGGNYTLHKL